MRCARLVSNRNRRGNILVVTAFLMAGMVAIIACAVDLGYLQMAKTELQRSADAAAIAGAWELIEGESLSSTSSMAAATATARTTARDYAALNKVCTTAPDVDTSNSGDVVVGYLANPSNPNGTIDSSAALLPLYNTVQVRVRRVAGMNGEVPFFFAHAFGMNSVATQSQATAAVIKNMKGFQAPSNGGNLGILPFALDVNTWNNMLAGGGTDQWAWDEMTGEIASHGDGVREVNLYPQGTGSPGNRGTVDIGSSSNSTSDISRQILEGVSPADLAHHGGKLEFDSNGKLYLNGDTGISAGIKDELASIKGQPRVIPLFESVVGPGNNATYTIVAFAGIRILDVKLTGSMSSKRVTIQPAKVFMNGAIPSTGTTPTSHFVYSGAWLVR